MWARVLREGGAIVPNKQQRLADMRLPGVSAGDNRQIEIVAKNLPMFHSTPLACDATIGSPIAANGQAQPKAHTDDGVAIAKAEKDKEATYPELVNSSQCRLVVLACEIGGRWSDTCVWLVRELAEYRAQEAPRRLRRSTALAWENRWWGMLSVTLHNSVAATLVDDAPHLLHSWHGTGPPLGRLLHGEAPSTSRLPLR